jgi:hypothetical protein
LFFALSCCKKYVCDVYPEYKLIKRFSQRIESETGLALFCYGANNYLPKDYKFKNGVACFNASYLLCKNKFDSISLDEARCIIVSLANSFVKEVNYDAELRPLLDVYPFPIEFVEIGIHFIDQNKIELGQGVSYVYLAKNNLKYEGYNIIEYSDQYPAMGKHYKIHEETYSEALEIVNSQGCLRDL